jgi:PAS domain S-box-containing protein
MPSDIQRQIDSHRRPEEAEAVRAKRYRADVGAAASTAGLIALLAALYFLSGKLGLLLSVPPGYATIIWPASGISVGALLIYGNRLWPGVFIGSFILNASLAGAEVSGAGIPWEKAATAAGIAAGSTLQALFARFLVKRFMDIPINLTRLLDAAVLFGLTGPVACLVAASTGTATLYFGGVLAADQVFNNWSTWWLGDVFGVIVFLPLTFVTPGGERLNWRGARIGALPIASVLILLLPLGLTFYAWKAMSEYNNDRSTARFAALADENEKALQHRLASYDQGLLGGLGFFLGSEFVSRSEWRDYVNAIDLRKNFPGINGIGYVARVPAQDIDRYVAGMRADDPDFTVHPPTVERPYFIIQYIEPIEINREALGLNIGFEDNRVEAAVLSRDTGQPAITKRILLVQDDTQSPGFLLLHPMYQAGALIDTVTQRRRALRGWVYAPFVGRSFMADLTQAQGKLLNLQVYDGITESADTLIYSSDEAGDGPRKSGSFVVRKTVDAMQQTWTLVWTSTSAFDAAATNQEPRLILAGGLIFTGLFGALLLILSRRAQTVERLVAEQTKEIAASEKQMKLLIRHTPAAVAMFDSDMRYIMTSERWISDYHLEGRKVIGRSHYDVFSDLADAGDRSDIHQRVLAGESISVDEDSWKGAHGRSEWVKWEMHPWLDATGQIGGIVIFTEVITDRKRAEARAQILKDVAVEAVRASSMESIFKSVLEKMTEYLSWHVGHAYIWSQEHGALVSSGIWHLADDADPVDAFQAATAEFQFKPGVGLPGRVLSERQAIVIADVAADPNFPRNARVPDLHLHAGIGIPVFVGGRVTAVLELYSERHADLMSGDEDFLESLCIQLSRVAERRSFEEALERSNNLNNAVLNSADYMIVATDRAGKVLVFNRAAERKSGYSADEVVGKLTPAVWHDTEEVIERAQELSGELGETVEPGFDVFVRLPSMSGSESREWTFIRKDGSRFPVNLTVTPLKGDSGEVVGFLGILEDITLRNQQTAALEASEETFRSAMQYAPTGMGLVGLDGRWLKVNPALGTLLGYSEEELLATTIENVTHPEDREKSLAARQQVLGEEAPSYQIEKRLLHKSGRAIWVSTNASLLYHADGTPRCFIVQIQDITERREMERVKSEFISVVSHELRTPLTSIRGSLGLIAGTMSASLPEKANRLVEIAHKNSERLILLINDILDMDKIATGNMRFDLKPEDLTGVVEQAIEANRAYAERFGAVISLDAGPTPPTVVVDASRLTQVLTNLLSNASKFSPPNGRVTVRIETLAATARVLVSDQGKGIPPEFQQKIFGQFSQADSSVTREKGGTGLGLHISKQLVERMNGRIGFESAEAQGTTFWIELPLAGSMTQAPRQAQSVQGAVPASDGTEDLPHILHVEDDADLSRWLAAALQGRARITTASTLRSAKKELAARPFSLIVLDIGLPDGSGLVLLEQVASFVQGRPPVIVLSANEVQPSASQQIYAVLVKSRVSEEKIVATILQATDNSPERGGEQRLAS